MRQNLVDRQPQYVHLEGSATSTSLAALRFGQSHPVHCLTALLTLLPSAADLVIWNSHALSKGAHVLAKNNPECEFVDIDERHRTCKMKRYLLAT